MSDRGSGYRDQPRADKPADPAKSSAPSSRQLGPGCALMLHVGSGQHKQCGKPTGDHAFFCLDHR